MSLLLVARLCPQVTTLSELLSEIRLVVPCMQRCVHFHVCFVVVFNVEKNLSRNKRCKRNRKKAVKINRADLYVVQLGSGNKVRESRPCAHCMAVIKTFGIRRIFYSTHHGTFCMEHVNNDIAAEPTFHMRGLLSSSTFRF